jgi:nitrate reductase beta subunit
VNLLNWDGKGSPSGLFPPKRDDATRDGPTADGEETR